MNLYGRTMADLGGMLPAESPGGDGGGLGDAGVAERQTQRT